MSDTQGTLDRVEKFVDEWAKLEKRGYDDTIHGLHFGTDREAELLASDIRRLLSLARQALNTTPSTGEEG